MKNKKFNIIITGCGGQGVLTLAEVIAKAALISGLDIKISEVHGLSQRGGHLEAHLKFGKKVYSSLVAQADADLILALEPLEALRCLKYASDKTRVAMNTAQVIPIAKYQDKKEYPNLEEMIKNIKLFTNKIFYTNATKLVKKAVGTTVPLNAYMLGFAFYKGLLPLKRSKLLDSIKSSISEKYFEINKKVFELAKSL
jgi:indolepyruvate ferredoxin oxidoreductase beta subunit